MPRDSAVTVELAEFMKSIKKFNGDQYPMAIAKAFRRIANGGKEDVQNRTRSEYNLHSDFIPQGIKSTPYTNSQMKAGARSIEKYHDIEAAVYVRGANSPEKSLDFMVNHDTGEDKRAQGGMLAIPAGDLKNYAYKTSRGKVKKMYKPATLLKEYNRVGPNKKGRQLQKKGKRGKGAAFIMTTKSGTKAIVRKLNPKQKSLQFLYFFKKDADIKATWQFEPTVLNTVSRTYQRDIAHYFNKIKPIQ